MSNALGIAAVTAVLRDLLNNGMIDHHVSTAIGNFVTVSALPPDRVPLEGGEGNGGMVGLNLFLYQVSPNPGWMNVGLPSRDRNGGRISSPPLPLDLHYLLTAYGVEDFQAEILLGYAMQLLHETPILSRSAIRTALGSPTPLPDVALPPAYRALAGSELADQVEQIRITPHFLNPEEMSRLWTALQAKYRPTAAYQVSVVLIESAAPGRSPLPVLTRGERVGDTGRDEGVRVMPSLLPTFPTLQELSPPERQPAIRMGEVLTLRGHHLSGDAVSALFTEARGGTVLELPALAGSTATEIRVQLPLAPPADPEAALPGQDPERWRIGFYSVSARVEQEGRSRVTNELPLVLAPLISAEGEVEEDEVTIEVTCAPAVRRTQQAVLIVGQQEIRAEAFEEGSADTLTFRSSTDVLPPGSHWTRLRVDGIESLLVDRSGPVPVFDPSQEVTI
jgi:hypothetical protein